MKIKKMNITEKKQKVSNAAVNKYENSSIYK